MIHHKTSLLPFLIIFAIVSIASDVHAGLSIREFRPVEPARVNVRAVQSDDHESALLRKGWEQYDKKAWDHAIGSFLDVVEVNPGNKAAAEGLAMSLYHSGDYKSAYRFAFELEGVVPRVREMMEGLLISDVRLLIEENKIEEAQNLVRFFPESGKSYAEAHQLVRTTCTIEAALTTDGDTTSDPQNYAAR